MEEDLSKKKCIPCEGNIPAFDYAEIHKYLKKVDGWNVNKNENDSIFLLKILNLKILKKVKNL